MGMETQAGGGDGATSTGDGGGFESALDAAGAEFLAETEAAEQLKESEGEPEAEDEDGDLTEGDEPEEDAEDSEDEGEAEDDEQTEEDAGDEPPKTRAQRRREKIEQELRPQVRAEVEAELAPQIQAYREQVQQREKQIQEVTGETAEAHLLVRFATQRLELLEKALDEAGLMPRLAAPLEVLVARQELERHKERDVQAREIARLQQESSARERQQMVKARMAELTAMARGAGVDPQEFKIRLAVAHSNGEKVDPVKLLEKLKPKPARRRKPAPIPGGGNSDGAPDFPKVNLDTPSDELASIIEAQMELDAKKGG